MNSMSNEQSEFDFMDGGRIAIINGQERLHETEQAAFKRLVDYNHQPIVVDDLFKYPERIQVLKLMNIETIIMGTTGIYAEKINSVIDVFETLGYMPKHVIFTMGEDVFWSYQKQGVTFYKISPMCYSDEQIMITKIS